MSKLTHIHFPLFYKAYVNPTTGSRYSIQVVRGKYLDYDIDKFINTLELVKNNKGLDIDPKPIQIAYFKKGNKGYYLHFVEDRIFTIVDYEDILPIKQLLKDSEIYLREKFRER